MPLSAHLGVAEVAACVAIISSSLGLGVALYLILASLGKSNPEEKR
jgi:hypothetical protein